MRPYARTFAAIVGLLLAAVGFVPIGPASAAASYSVVTLALYGVTITASAISPDGSRALFVDEDGHVHLIDATSRKEVGGFTLPGEPGHPYQARISPDGQLVALGSGKSGVSLRRVDTGQEVWSFDPQAQVLGLAFSGDGRRLIVVRNNGIETILDAADGRQVGLLTSSEENLNLILDAELNADGSKAVSASVHQSASVWDVASGKELLVLKLAGGVNGASFSQDGRRVAVAGDDGLAHVFDAASGEELLTLKGHDGPVRDARFSPDGTRIVTGSDDRTARVWDAASGSELAVLSGHIEGVVSVAFASDGEHVLTIAQEVTARIWTPLAENTLPAGAAGLWTLTQGLEGDMLAGVVRSLCLSGPIVVRSNGRVVFFDGTPTEAPRATLTLTCRADLTCQASSGEPGIEIEGEATIAFDGDKGQVCGNRGCQPMVRCAAMEWSPEERASGFAEAWEKQVLEK